MPHLRETAAVNVRAVFARPAYRGLLGHAKRVARDRGTEAIGWLLGYFSPDAVTVLDAVPATRYKFQTRYGAQADPREELEVATSYPRNVGIVGLYHSHPFRDETRHAIFHSATDDTTLRSRASRRGEYLSVVTDGQDAEVFVLEREKRKVEPEVVEDLSFREVLRRYSCDVSVRVEEDVTLAAMDGLLSALEKAVSRRVAKALKGEAAVDRAKGLVSVPDLRDEAQGNNLRVVRKDGGASVDLQVRSQVAVYVTPQEEEHVLAVVKDEIQDDIVYLLWNGLGPHGLTGPVVDLEANLGSLRVHETNPLPKKMYKPGKRALVVKKGANLK